jgi:hypothetical protein
VASEDSRLAFPAGVRDSAQVGRGRRLYRAGEAGGEKHLALCRGLSMVQIRDCSESDDDLVGLDLDAIEATANCPGELPEEAVARQKRARTWEGGEEIEHCRVVVLDIDGVLDPNRPATTRDSSQEDGHESARTAVKEPRRREGRKTPAEENIAGTFAASGGGMGDPEDDDDLEMLGHEVRVCGGE